jgi:hypothetical protein
MRILALDPAEYELGWALGEAGAKPKVGLLKLRDKGESTEEAIGRFAKWLHGQLTTPGDRMLKVELLAFEHFLPSGALKGRTTDETREGAIGLNYAARATASICNVPFRSPYPNTIRKHFIGRASMGDRDATKRAVIVRAHQLGYLSKDCFDDNMADAAALFDFSSSHFANKAAAFQLA